MTALKEVKLLTAAHDLAMLEKIVDRVLPMAARAKAQTDREYWLTLLGRCHSIYPLDLEALYTSPDAEFANDVFGIRSYTEWRSGRLLTEYWRPDCLKGGFNVTTH